MVLAQRVCKQISPESLFHDSIHRFNHLFLYGAVAPDSCFHYLLGPCSSVVKNAGHIFHTFNSDSLIPILEFLKKFPREDPDALAFAAGLCCHIVTDTCFHPMVDYFSGMDGLHKGATIRHRMFETALDLHFRFINKIDGSENMLHYVLKNLEVSNDRLACFLKKSFSMDNAECQKYLFYALKSHHFLNRLFTNDKIHSFAKLLSHFMPGFFEEYEVLFYPFKTPVKFKFFDQRLNYKNPVTGTDHRQSIEDLSKKTVDAVLLLLSIIDASMRSGEDLSDVIFNSSLPKIAPCLPQQTEEFNYWHGQTELKQILYRDITF